MEEQITIDHYLKLRIPEFVKNSKDGKQLGFIVNSVFKEYQKDPENELHILEVEKGTEHIFREKGKNFVNLLFLSKEDRKCAVFQESSKTYIWIFREIFSEGLKVLCPGNIVDIKEFDENNILVLINHEDNKVKSSEGTDGEFFEEDIKPNELYILSMDGGFHKINTQKQIWEFDTVGKLIVAVASEGPTEGSWYNNFLIQLKEDGECKKIYTQERGQIANPRLNTNCQKVAVIESVWSDRGVCSGDIVLVDLESQKYENISESMEVSFSSVRWSGIDEFFSLGQNGADFQFIHFKNKNKKTISTFRGNIYPSVSADFSLTKEKIAYFTFTNISEPAEVFQLNLLNGNFKKITNINSELLNTRKFPWKDVSWKSEDGLEIHGFLRNPGNKNPLMVMIHGGPTGSVKETFLDRYSFLLEGKWSIFMPNFRGSTGKGRKFAEMNMGDMGGKDLQDIISGVKMLVREGYADPDKIVIIGGSYGGFMAQWAITQTDIFKGSITLFGISNWVSFHGTTNIPEWDEIQYEESAYADGKFQKFSPLRYVENINCPVLIMHGKEDPSVPVSQSMEFYRALKQNGKDVRFLIFPREGHGFMEKNHILQSLRETQTFLNQIMDKSS